MSNNIYRYQLERYRGRSTRYICPQCGSKQVFTKYIDTYNNIYINDKVGMCNRLDKCGYHYTPKQYFEDNPWLKEDKFSFFQNDREIEKMKMKKPPQSEPQSVGAIPWWSVERSTLQQAPLTPYSFLSLLSALMPDNALLTTYC